MRFQAWEAVKRGQEHLHNMIHGILREFRIYFECSLHAELVKVRTEIYRLWYLSQLVRNSSFYELLLDQS
jgi:hypothetical protein